MASVKTTIGKKTKGSSTWNIEKLSNTVFKFDTSSSKKAKVLIAGKGIEIDKYYLSLPSNLTNREINYIITEMGADELISCASVSIDYYAKFNEIVNECKKITISRCRDDYYQTEVSKLQENYAGEIIKNIININNLIAPYSWQLTPIYDPITLNNVTIPCGRGERVFVLQVL